MGLDAEKKKHVSFLVIAFIGLEGVFLCLLALFCVCQYPKWALAGLILCACLLVILGIIVLRKQRRCS